MTLLPIDARQGIRCVHCGSARSKVIDSRKIIGGIRRRRECFDCGKRHSTVEVLNHYLRHLNGRGKHKFREGQNEP